MVRLINPWKQPLTISHHTSTITLLHVYGCDKIIIQLSFINQRIPEIHSFLRVCDIFTTGNSGMWRHCRFCFATIATPESWCKRFKSIFNLTLNIILTLLTSQSNHAQFDYNYKKMFPSAISSQQIEGHNILHLQADKMLSKSHNYTIYGAHKNFKK